MRSIEANLLRGELRARAWRMASTLADALFPRCCVFCGVENRDGERHICAACREDLPWIANACSSCATPLPTAASVVCADCQRDPPPIVSAIAPLEYAFPIDAAIKAMKFHRKLHYVPAFRELLLSVATRLPEDVDALLPVPLHRWRQLRRGFNQAAELAQPFEARLDAACINNVVRQVATPSQSGLDAAQRARNLKTAFRVQGRIDARHVLIVDDVVTTGATCRTLAELLLARGVSRVSVLAVARA